jgi:hypothetical protein
MRSDAGLFDYRMIIEICGHVSRSETLIENLISQRPYVLGGNINWLQGFSSNSYVTINAVINDFILKQGS